MAFQLSLVQRLESFDQVQDLEVKVRVVVQLVHIMLFESGSESKPSDWGVSP